mgnify:CR=1 FL=1
MEKSSQEKLLQLDRYIQSLKVVCSEFPTEKKISKLKAAMAAMAQLQKILLQNQPIVEQPVILDKNTIYLNYSGENMAYPFGDVEVKSNSIFIEGYPVEGLGFDQKNWRILDLIINLLKTLQSNLIEMHTCYEDGDCNITKELSNTLEVFNIFVKIDLLGKVKKQLTMINQVSPVADKLRTISSFILEIIDSKKLLDYIND